jgi:hypothetical protein
VRKLFNAEIVLAGKVMGRSRPAVICRTAGLERTQAAEYSLLAIGQYIATTSQSLETAVRVLCKKLTKNSQAMEVSSSGSGSTRIEKGNPLFSVHYVGGNEEGLAVSIAIDDRFWTDAG